MSTEKSGIGRDFALRFFGIKKTLDNLSLFVYNIKE
jgi:hypothetical protein